MPQVLSICENIPFRPLPDMPGSSVIGQCLYSFVLKYECGGRAMTMIGYVAPGTKFDSKNLKLHDALTLVVDRAFIHSTDSTGIKTAAAGDQLMSDYKKHRIIRMKDVLSAIGGEDNVNFFFRPDRRTVPEPQASAAGYHARKVKAIHKDLLTLMIKHQVVVFKGIFNKGELTVCNRFEKVAGDSDNPEAFTKAVNKITGGFSISVSANAIGSITYSLYVGDHTLKYIFPGFISQ